MKMKTIKIKILPEDEITMQCLFRFIGEEGSDHYPKNPIIKAKFLEAYADDIMTIGGFETEERAENLALVFIQLYKGLKAPYIDGIVDQLDKELKRFLIDNKFPINCKNTKEALKLSISDDQKSWLRDFIIRYDFFNED